MLGIILKSESDLHRSRGAVFTPQNLWSSRNTHRVGTKEWVPTGTKHGMSERPCCLGQYSPSQQLDTDQGTASELISFPFPEPCRLAQIYRMMQPADCWFLVKPLFEVGFFLRLKFKSHNRRDTKSFKRVYSRVGDFLQVQNAVNSGHKNEQSWPLAQFAQLFGQRQRLRHVRQT